MEIVLFSCLFFETGVSYIVQDGLKFVLILQPLPPACWNYRPWVEMMFSLCVCTRGYLHVSEGTYRALRYPWSGCWALDPHPLEKHEMPLTTHRAIFPVLHICFNWKFLACPEN